MDFDQSKLLYEKVGKISMYPPNADLKLFQFGQGEERNESLQQAVTNGIGNVIGAMEAIKKK